MRHSPFIPTAGALWPRICRGLAKKAEPNPTPTDHPWSALPRLSGFGGGGVAGFWEKWDTGIVWTPLQSDRNLTGNPRLITHQLGVLNMVSDG